MSLLIRLIDRLSALAGMAGSLVLPLLILTILANVVLRYVFDIGMIELEELQWHLNAIAVMLSLAWAYQEGDHVRVDMFHAKMRPRARAVVEILGILFLFWPFTALVAWNAWTIFGYSWDLKEGSPMPSGLPARYVIKGVMALGLSLLALQGLAVLLRAVRQLRTGWQEIR
ncbi:TRAP transporter small permease subunit [Mangrovicoccus sp. HB161399]|uniref:TRAP transporter small permease subunit n=1 Tax=Mangrovicoccus sp. HB161399 TaxID=2720392 RepID=UPI0015559665|nr:TRAP transporter small permease subunit [Mangrovicoccus sp. HB161399]